MTARMRQNLRLTGTHLAALLAGLLLLIPAIVNAEPIQNSASGSVNGFPLDLSNATVNLNSTGGGSAVDTVIAEINPGNITTATNTGFTVAVQPTILAGNTGLDLVAMTAPAGYGNIAATGISIDGTPVPAGTCPTPAAGTICTQVSGNLLTATFGTPVTTSNAVILISFTADTPAVAGSSTFVISVDRISTPVAAQSALPGDADGITTNNDSLEVTAVTGIDPNRSSLIAEPPIVVADNITTSTLTVTLVDTAGNPVTGHNFSLSSDRGGLDTLSAPAPTDLNGQTTATIRSGTVGVSTITATDTTIGAALNQQAEVYFTQGLVMDVRKSANKEQVQIGDVISYRVELRNLTTSDVILAQLTDELPANFVYRAGSARLDGLPMTDPTGVRTLSFPIGTIPALADSNGNGVADPGEQGYHEVSYQLIVGAGAVPGTYVNTAYASDVCVDCAISNRSEYPVEVTFDPMFDLGTIIGKVFEDTNRNGRQDPGESGIAGAMVALDNGSYIKTDPHGRYHFPAVKPGQRLLKINLAGLGNGATATTWEAQVVAVTPGLLSKVNFGVSTRFESSSIGREVEHGLRLDVTGGVRPLEIHGNASGDYLLVNGQSVQLPNSDIRLQLNTIDNVVQIKSGLLTEPISFVTFSGGAEQPTDWSLTIFAADGTAIHTLGGSGAPQQPITWNGRLDSGELLSGGQIYHYQLQNSYADGTTVRSPRRMFGVDRSSAIAMNLTGSAFVSGSDRLSPAAQKILSEAADILRRHPDETIIIEGHSDAIGAAAYNLDLSTRRARAALQHLVEVEGLAIDRFVTRGFGEEKPLASNRLPEGRELNRRVEIKGEFEEVERARLLDQYRAEPNIAINGSDTPVDDFGRFQTRSDGSAGYLDIALSDEQGKTVQKRIKVPACEILAPDGSHLLPYGQQEPDGTVTAAAKDQPLDTDATLVRSRLRGRTDPGNSVRLDDRPLEVDEKGFFSSPLFLKQGVNVASLAIRNSDGMTRLADLKMTVRSRDELGGYVVFAEPIPFLTVQMPPTDKPLSKEALLISGQTAASNRLTINGAQLQLDADGKFSHTQTLPQGESLLKITVTDPAGHTGSIDRTVTVSDHQLFLLAFADGKISQLTSSGNLKNAGTTSRKEIVTEGRIALYLKGQIAGRYLLTAALDTGTGDISDLFKDLDDAETDRLLTNLDPDKLYPVYGDSSSLVYDTESQGKLYLALDSDELHLLIGNYRLDLQQSELASYRRTLFGAHAIYRSADKTMQGDSETEIELFGAEIRQMHVRDEVDATGGSLYYLSQNEIIEGSEQVTILIRDRLTGLPLMRLPQERNLDYSIKYSEGRLLFRRPISAVQNSDQLIDPNLMSGNPVSIQIDYEAVADRFEKTAYGGRVRQNLGSHLTIGATAVKDETDAGPYELLGADAEIRLGDSTRLLTEYATSKGQDATVNISRDGGLNYTSLPASGTEEGHAWKATAELDIGSWFDRPDLLKTLFYHKRLEDGFRAAGQTDEQGTEKSGGQLLWNMSQVDQLLARYNQEKRDAAPPLSPARLRSALVQWRHTGENWRLLTEYQGRESEDAAGSSLARDQLVALRIEADLTRRLTGWAEQQVPLTGDDQSLTTLGLDYRPIDALSLLADASAGRRGYSAEAGASLLLGKNRIYLTQRLLEEEAERRNVTVFGGENNDGPFGSRLYTEYLLTRSNAGNSNVSLFGAEKKWQFDSGLQLMLGGEWSEARRSTGESSQFSLATGLVWHHEDLLTLTMRAELREQQSLTRLQQFLTSNRIEGKLGPDFSLIGTYRYSVSENKTSGIDEAGFEETSLGLAFRPTGHDRFNALARATRLTDRRPVGTGSTIYLDTLLDTISVEWSLQVTRALEWVEKNALRWKEESDPSDSFQSRSWLSLHRLNYLFDKNIDAGLEYRRLTEDASSGLRQGWLSEIGWRPKKQVRLGIGYNFTDFSDDERSLNNYSVQGWYLRIQGIY